jgi:hypothetical protein
LFQFAEDKNPSGFERLQRALFRDIYLVPSSLTTISPVNITAYVVVQTGEAHVIGQEGLLHYVDHLSWLGNPTKDDCQLQWNRVYEQRYFKVG